MEHSLVGSILIVMTKNPWLNALAATLYIFLVVVVMSYGNKLTSHNNNAIIIPIAVLSLFTLSAAVMGYLFLAQPLQLYLDGDKKRAVAFFLQTVAIFAGITAVFFILLFSRILL